MKRQILWTLSVAFLLAAHSFAADQPKPLWTVDLRPLGYKPPSCGWKTTVRFWQQHLFIELKPVPTLRQDPKTHKTSIYPDAGPAKLWVFDVNNGQPVSAGASVPSWEALPETAVPDYFRTDLNQNEIEMGRWRGMKILRESNSEKLYLEREGQPRTVLFSGGDRASAAFLAPDRLLIGVRMKIQGKDGSLVVDSRGSQTYALEEAFDYLALDGMGSRFAGYEAHISGLRSVLAAAGDTNFEPNRASVQVFSARDGKNIFHYSWKGKNEQTIAMNEPSLQYNRLIALSDDGSQLAVVRGHELLLFNLPPVLEHSATKSASLPAQ